jgi:hypothetical protein
LFEAFVARLLELYGYDRPTAPNLNVTSDGIELDVVTQHALTGQPAIAECKAFSTNLPASALDQFYGKLSVARLTTPDTLGIFAALPGLTQPGNERARAIQTSDRRFLVLTADTVVSKLREKAVLGDPPRDATVLLSDLAVIISEHGVFSAVKQLDANTRLPQEVRVWGIDDPVPAPVLDLVSSSDFAAGLPVRRLIDPLATPAPVGVEEPYVVEVIGGRGDFDYQLPTTSKFFVGRRTLVARLEDLLAPATPQGQVVVVNAQSGWGKSSLALRFKARAEINGGLALVLDARTAAGPDFVRVALREAALRAQKAGILTLRSDASFAGLSSALETIAAATWANPLRPLVLFFDQFEVVFQDARLAREFRDLALGISELQAPVLIGFAWKTDLLGWTESYPYRLRDEIRGRAIVHGIPPLGPPEVTTLLGRLERELGLRLLPPLKRRLREYSQGLPWLFKKLANHLLTELRDGKSQEALLSERLNVTGLFESDLAQLGPHEQAALRALARQAPVGISDALELADASVVQTLVDQRLVVQVGGRLDIYWDIFRDYLNTGRVPVEETYILRVTPTQVARLLTHTIAAGGATSVSEAAQSLNTSEGVIFNAARDLRQLGVFTSSPGQLRVTDEILASADREEAVREQVGRALRGHKAYSLLVGELEACGGEITLARYAEVVPQAFPAVKARPKTWTIYARAFVTWFSHGGLLSHVGQRIRLGGSSRRVEKLLGRRRVNLRRRHTFPQSPPAPAIDVARVLAGGRSQMTLTHSAITKAISDLISLGIAEQDEERNISLTTDELFRSDGSLDRTFVLGLLGNVQGGRDALQLLDHQPNASSRSIGRVLGDAQGATWSDSTAALSGKFFRGWARVARAQPARRHESRGAETIRLFDEPAS